MLKKIVTIIATSTYLLATQMPPMPPMVPTLEVKTKKPTEKKRSSVPKSCELIPPMVVFIPPPMENMLNECKNSMNMPSYELANNMLIKNKKSKIKDIQIAKSFIQLYKIDVESNKSIETFYCNKDVNSCIKGEVIDVK
ncbi:MAG: hypothetical protein U9N42_02115 [Campylobacterota bacterium]|nr:hypothetical protein [Campylobacterota bacterium]